MVLNTKYGAERSARVIGLVTIGQTPRDDLAARFAGLLRHTKEMRLVGALDATEPVDVMSAARRPARRRLLVRLADGSTRSVPQEFLGPNVQSAVTRLVNDGATLVTVLCDSDWSELDTGTARFVEPAAAIRAELDVWRHDVKRLGLVVPFEGQDLPGCSSAKTISLSPFAAADRGGPVVLVAARKLAGVDGVYLRCMGYDDQTAAALSAHLSVPVITSSQLLHRALHSVASKESTWVHY